MPDIITPFEIAPYPNAARAAAGERVVVLAAQIRAAENSTDDRPIIEIASTSEGEDRHGSRLFEWDTKTHMRTGHVLWQHDECAWLPPVAKKLSERKDGKVTISKHELLINLWRHIEQAHGNLPAFLWEAFRVHGMGAISRAFIPLEWKARKAETIPSELAENIDYLRVEQTEESYVNVPSNRDAFARAIERTRTAGRLTDQLARVLGYEITPIILSTKESEMPTRTVESFRSSLADVLKRCCGCEPYREPKPDALSDEQKAAEVARLTALAKAYLATMDLALEGWRTGRDQGIYSNMVVEAMYRVEGLLWLAKEWYGVELALDVPVYEGDELQRVIASTASHIVIEARASRHAKPTEQRTAYREKATALLRCCGCDFGCEEPPVLPSDDAARALEIATLREIAAESMTQVEIGMRGWTAVTTERLRGMCQWMLTDGMYRYDNAVRYLAEWYGEDLEAVPDVDMEDVGRALTGYQHRAGAVFAKKNLDKIDQAIALLQDLRAAANKPTAEDVPEEERAVREAFARICARLANEDDTAFAERMTRLAAEMQRIAGPFEFASTQVTLEGDVAEAVLALAATIPDEALGEKGRETSPHVTVKFGIDAATTPEALLEALTNSDSAREMMMRGGGELTLGATAIFESEEGSHANGDDVVYVAVDSPDLVLLNQIISEALTVTDTHPDYVPHITLAYVKKGEGQKYAGNETLAGTVVTFTSIVFSDADGNETEIPLAGESVPAETEERSVKIRIKSGDPSREQDAASHKIRVLVPDTPRDRRGDDPSRGRSTYVRLLND
jgi:2'-5' RNA ligase